MKLAFILGIVILFILFSNTVIFVEAVDPFSYLNSTYTYQFYINNTDYLRGLIVGGDSFNNGEDFALLWDDGTVKMYHENNPYSEYEIFATVPSATGIAEVPKELYPADVAVTDYNSINFYTQNGTFVDGINTGSEVLDITYDRQRDRLIISKTTGIFIVNGSGHNTLLTSLAPIEGIQYIDMEEGTQDMLQRENYFDKIEADGSFWSGSSFETNLQGPISALIYTNSYAITVAKFFYFFYDKLEFQDHMQVYEEFQNLQIEWLLSQQNPITGLVDSYEGDGENYAYTYDQALAIIAFTEANDTDNAKTVLSKMESLQLGNGAWYQCYDATNGNLGAGGCNYYPTGDISWIVMAINFYEAKTGNSNYSSVAHKALSWLDSVRNTNPEEQEYGSLDLCRGTACLYPNSISTENNYDAYSAYYYRGILEDNYSLIEKGNLVKDYLVKEMWSNSPDVNCLDPHPAIFWLGYNDCDYWTDPQSWGILALGPTGPDSENYTLALEWLYEYGYGWNSTRHNQTFNPEIDGFDFYTKGPLNSVWLEGTEGVAAAYYSIGENEKGDYFHGQTKKLIDNNGGVIYSFSETDPTNIRWNVNFRRNSVASTSWYYFNEKKINPFKPIPQISFNISLKKGWNLISIPIAIPNIDISSVFNGSKILGFNGSWFVPEYFDRKLGYWVNVNSSFKTTLSGEFVSMDSDLDNDWQLVGYPYLEMRNVDELYANFSVYFYKGSWISYVPNRSINTLTTLIPGKGYWVKK